MAAANKAVEPTPNSLRSYVAAAIGRGSPPALDRRRTQCVNRKMERFNRPNALERVVNKVFGLLIGLGLGLPHNYLLQVRGRKSGRLYSTPVDVLTRNGWRFLVAGRGYTQWVRNAEASGTVSLKRGRWCEEFRIHAVPDEEKPEILKEYLDRFKVTVQRYFPVPAGSPTELFRPVATHYPVFELMPEG